MRKQLRNEIKNNNNLTQYAIDEIEIALSQDWRTRLGKAAAFNSLLNAQECGEMTDQYSDHFLAA